MNLIGERDAKYVFISSFEMCDIRLLPLLPVSFPFALCSIRKAVRTRGHHSSDAIAEPIANVFQASLTTLILDTVVKKGRDR
jgi:hypothetical protein